MTARVVVIGGGIAGLVAAHRLADDFEVTLIEASERVGGKFYGFDLAGGRFEAGPDSFLARDPAAIELCRELDLGGELVAPAIFGARVWLPGGLRSLPHGFPFGLPASPWRAWRGGVLSFAGAARAAADLVLPASATGDEVSVGAYVRRRFGAQVLERLVDPLLGGTRAGLPDDLSLAAALPQIDALASRSRSFILGLRRAGHEASDLAGPPPFLAPKGGMGRLIEALTEVLGRRARVTTGARVEALSRPRAWRLELAGGDSVEADGVVLAVPAFEAARLLREACAPASRELEPIRYATVATVAFVYGPGALDPPAGTSGLLVPGGAGRALAAATWFDRKWPHLAPGDGRSLVKAFAGRAAGDRVLALDDDDLADVLAADLGAALGTSARPLEHRITRWPDALPQYELGHLGRVTRAEAALGAMGGAVLAGGGYRGSGIPACIGSAEAAAAALSAYLST